MEFIRLNWWKVICILVLCIVISSCFVLLAYIVMGEHIDKSELTEELPLMLLFMYGAALAIFVLFIFGGTYNFYRTKRLLSYALTFDLFDNGDFQKGYANVKSWLFYTKECFIGTINQYPIVLWIDISTGARRTSIRIAITFYVMKNDKTTPWTIYMPLNWRGELEQDIKVEITNTVLMLGNNGYKYGDLSKGMEMDDTILAAG